MTTPLKTAPPPTSAVLSMLILLGLSLTYLPSALKQIHDAEARPEAFTDRIYPRAVSVPSLAAARLLFGSVCWAVTVYSILRSSVKVRPPYIRSHSKLLDANIEISGIRHLFPLTSWSWMVLGTHFLLSGAATVWCHHASTAPPQWILVVALVLWKIAAPITLLIGIVCKYVLWDGAIKESGPNHVMKTPIALLQHNANIAMALTELLFLGGLPFDGKDGGDGSPPCSWTYICLPVIYGVVYIFFSWSTMSRWNRTEDDPAGEKLGPGAIYFFMDTTLGWRHTVILYCLLGVLLLFYGLFSVVERFSDPNGEDPRYHATMMIGLMMLTCRFRD